MKYFYLYCGLVICGFIASLVWAFLLPKSEPSDNGVVTVLAIAGPLVVGLLIALGWSVLIFIQYYIQKTRSMDGHVLIAFAIIGLSCFVAFKVFMWIPNREEYRKMTNQDAAQSDEPAASPTPETKD